MKRVGVFVALVAGASYCLLAVVRNWVAVDAWLKAEQHLSGWFQALGVIITVVAGYLSLRGQIAGAHDVEAAKRKAERLGRIEIVRHLVEHVVMAVDAADRALFADKLRDISGRVAALNQAAEALISLPPLDVPGAPVALHVVQLPPLIERFTKNVERTHEELQKDRGAHIMYPNLEPTDIPSRVRMLYSDALTAVRAARSSAVLACDEERHRVENPASR